jgi:hypothetical protein
MPVLEGEAAYTGGETYQQKFSLPPPGETTETPQPVRREWCAAVSAPLTPSPPQYDKWTRTWHLHPGLTESGQFETTAPVASSVLLARPWDAATLRTEGASGPLGWRATMEGVTEVSDTPWPFEVDRRNGRLKCLACCASANGECRLDSCGLKPPPLEPAFLNPRAPGETSYDPDVLAQHVAYQHQQRR